MVQNLKMALKNANILIHTKAFRLTLLEYKTSDHRPKTKR